MGAIEEAGGVRDLRKDWERLVFQEHRGICSNCGGEDRLRVLMVVPEEAGGAMKQSNGTLLCRGCEMALEGWRSRPRDGRDKHPLNLWLSGELHTRLLQALSSPGGFGSMSALARFMMGSYVFKDEQFDDLDSYQDTEGPRVKINLWVDGADYALFKVKVVRLGRTVTSTVKALLQVYVDYSERGEVG